MTVYDLNRDQLQELKQQYYMTIYGDASYEIMSNIDSYVSDEDVYREYSNTYFTEDDFSTEENYHLEIDANGSIDNLMEDLRYIAGQLRQGYYSGLAPFGANWSLE